MDRSGKSPGGRIAKSSVAGNQWIGWRLGSLQDVHVANGADAHHVRKPGACAGMLARAGLAAELQGDLADLADAGRTDPDGPWRSGRPTD